MIKIICVLIILLCSSLKLYSFEKIYFERTKDFITYKKKVECGYIWVINGYRGLAVTFQPDGSCDTQIHHIKNKIKDKNEEN